jgi:predicted metal-dependent HD superfamily phosphohydrolase
MEDADSIELALWFHDVVYQPDAPDNEMASAERFKRSALETMSDDLVRQVHRLIMATTHENPPASIDEQFVVDIDLSSFGLPWDRFSQDSRNVRREFPHLNDREFARSSGKFLSRLLDRPGVYSTPFFKARLEETARENLRRQIAILESTLS